MQVIFPKNPQLLPFPKKFLFKPLAMRAYVAKQVSQLQYAMQKTH
jgi:hypothetical protein